VGEKWEKQWETQWEAQWETEWEIRIKVQGTLRIHARGGRSRDTTPLLLAIETKQLSAVGNIRCGCSLKTKKERTGTITKFFRSFVSPEDMPTGSLRTARGKKKHKSTHGSTKHACIKFVSVKDQVAACTLSRTDSIMLAASCLGSSQGCCKPNRKLVQNPLAQCPFYPFSKDFNKVLNESWLPQIFIVDIVVG